jgi:hypothetical protein
MCKILQKNNNNINKCYNNTLRKHAKFVQIIQKRHKS